jgi:hypothetical protein
MKKNLIVIAIAIMGLMLGSATFADQLSAADVTLPDGFKDNLWSGGPLGPAGEDNEVEHNNQTGQNWDLEAFRWDGSSQTLYVVGGFDPFAGNSYDGGVNPNRHSASDERWSLGDIWVTTEAGTDYVLDLDRQMDLVPSVYGDSYMNLDEQTKAFDVYQVVDNNTIPVNYTQYNQQANPYAYLAGANETAIGSGNYTEETYALGSEYSGSSHYVLAFDLSDFMDTFGGRFYVRLTEECGNDIMVGQVPEPTTILMALTGLAGIGFGRRRMRKILG